MARAKELLDLVKSPTAIATGVLVVFANARLDQNQGGPVQRERTWWALLAAILGAVLAGAVVAVMTPLAFRIAVTNRGNGVETRLLVYGLTYLVAVGTLLYVLWVVRRALQHLGFLS